jgi:hypothetical protein
MVFDGADGSGSKRGQPVKRHVVSCTLTQKLNIGELVRPRDLRRVAFPSVASFERGNFGIIKPLPELRAKLWIDETP